MLSMAAGAGCRSRSATICPAAQRHQHAGHHAVSGAGRQRAQTGNIVPVNYRGGHYT